MLKKDLLEKLRAIGTCENDVDRRELINNLYEEAGNDYDELETLKTTNQSLQEENDMLLRANKKLFLQVGADKDDESRKQGETGIVDEPEKELKFEDLFDEKGGIK